MQFIMTNRPSGNPTLWSRGNEAQIPRETEMMSKPPHVGCSILNEVLSRICPVGARPVPGRSSPATSKPEGFIRNGTTHSLVTMTTSEKTGRLAAVTRCGRGPCALRNCIVTPKQLLAWACCVLVTSLRAANADADLILHHGKIVAVD